MREMKAVAKMKNEKKKNCLACAFLKWNLCFSSFFYSRFHIFHNCVTHQFRSLIECLNSLPHKWDYRSILHRHRNSFWKIRRKFYRIMKNCICKEAEFWEIYQKIGLLGWKILKKWFKIRKRKEIKNNNHCLNC